MSDDCACDRLSVLVNPWKWVQCCPGMASHNPYPYPSIPITTLSRCYPYLCHALSTINVQRSMLINDNDNHPSSTPPPSSSPHHSVTAYYHHNNNNGRTLKTVKHVAMVPRHRETEPNRRLA